MVRARASRGFERLREAYERLREVSRGLREASRGFERRTRGFERLQEALTEFHHRRVFHRDVLTVTGQSRYKAKEIALLMREESKNVYTNGSRDKVL